MNKDITKRLLAVTSIDPALNAKKRPNTLVDLKTFIDENELFNFLWSESKQVCIKKASNFQIGSDLKETKTPEEFLDYCFLNSITLTKANQELISKKFSSSKEKVINDILKKKELIASLFNKFRRSANSIEQEENIYPLYIGAYFLNGNDINKQPINAPLLLWEVEVKEKNGEVTIIKKEDLPTVNEKLNYYLHYTYGLTIENREQFIDSIGDVNKYKTILDKLVSFEFKKEFEPFKPSNDSEQFELVQSVCLMLVEPMGGAIKQDIETIQKGNYDPFAINQEMVDNQKVIDSILAKDDLIEINRPLNIYQRYAIASAMQRNTLIYGPPGTGKSETIATLIANLIYRNKNVLMVSEKAAALEVLEQRLGDISKLALFAFKRDSKDKFYDSLLKIEDALTKINASQKNVIIDKINQEQQQIAFSFDKLKKQQKAIKEIEDDLGQKFQVNEIFEILSSINQEEKLKYTNEFYQLLLAFFNNSIDALFNGFKQVNDIYNLFKERTEVIEFLTKKKLSVSKEDVTSFIQQYNNSGNAEWMLGKFVRGKKNWNRKPWLFKYNVSNEVAVYKCLEDFVKSELNEIDFAKSKFILNLPELIRDEVSYKKYVVYNLVSEKFELHGYKQESIWELNKVYLSKKKEISKNRDADIFTYYIACLKESMEFGHAKQYKQEILEVISKTRLKRRPSINRLIARYYSALRILFPIWVLSPEQTCILNKCEKWIFDYGIFDEASQMFLERAYPLVYRCKVNVVAGDDKQLQPTSFFMKKIDDEETEIDDLVGTSLFEQANVCLWPRFYLRNHYRSVSADLIAFSNEYVYDNNLEFFTRNQQIENPITVYNVNGEWENRHNKKEIDTIIEILKKPDLKNKTILVVTFNMTQASYLENEFISNFVGTEMLDRLNNGKIMIKSLENVQGNEADVVIISVSYGKEKGSSKVRNFFGPLSQQNGINRLNVAITRAKERMVVIKSMYAKDIATSSNENNNVFKYFLNYVDTYAETSTKNKKINSEINFESDFEKEVYECLNQVIDKNTYQILTQYNVGKKRIDLAIMNKSTKNIDLAIEVDGFKYHSGFQKMMEDIDRQNFLEDLGYPVFRILEIEWKSNKDKVLKQVLSMIG